MDDVRALVADLDVTDAASDRLLLHGKAPSLAQAADADIAKPGPSQSHKAAAGAAAADNVAASKKQEQEKKVKSPKAAVYSRQGKQAPAKEANKGADNNKQAAAATRPKQAAAQADAPEKVGVTDAAPKAKAAAGAAIDEGSDMVSPGGTRPLRQRNKVQPYWMGTATDSSPSGRAGQRQTTLAASVLPAKETASAEVHPQAANPNLVGTRLQGAAEHVGVAGNESSAADIAKPGKAGVQLQKAAVAKRQAAGSPHKDQQPAKKSRAGSKAIPSVLEADKSADAGYANAAMPEEEQLVEVGCLVMEAYVAPLHHLKFVEHVKRTQPRLV